MLTMWIRLNPAQLIHDGVEPLRPLWAVSKENELIEASEIFRILLLHSTN